MKFLQRQDVPRIDIVSLAKGYGCYARRIEKLDDVGVESAAPWKKRRIDDFNGNDNKIGTGVVVKRLR